MKANSVLLGVVFALACSALAIENGDFFYGDANWSVYLESGNCSVAFYPDPYPDPYVRLIGWRLETTEIYQAETGFGAGETWRATFNLKSVSKGAGGYATIGWTDDSGDFGSYYHELNSDGTYTVDCDNPSFKWVTVHAQGSSIVNTIIEVDEISTVDISGVTPTPTPTPTTTPTPTPSATPTVTPSPTPSPTPCPPGNYFTLSTDWLSTQPFTIIPQAAYNSATHHLLVNTQSQIIVYDAETGQDTGEMLQDHPDHSAYFSVACAEDGTIYATEFWQYGWLYRWEDEWSTASLQIIPDLVYVVRNMNVRGTGLDTTIYVAGGNDNSCIQILRTSDGLNFYISDTVTSPAAKSDVGVKDANTVFGIQAWGSLGEDDHSRDFPARFDKIGDEWIRSTTFRAPDMNPYPNWSWSYSLAGDWADGVLWTLYFRPSVIVGLNDTTGEKVAQWDCPYELSFWAGLDVDASNHKIYFGARRTQAPYGLIGRLSYKRVTSSTVCQTDFDTGLAQWSSGAVESVFAPPEFEATPGSISLRTTNNTNTFGFWQSPEGLFVSSPVMLYRARVRVSSDVSSWDLAPAMRMRVSRPDFQQTDFLLANTLAAAFGGFASASVERTFDLYFAPADCPSTPEQRALNFAFDVLSFDPARAAEATLSLESLEFMEIAPAILGDAAETWQYTFDTGAQGWAFSGEVAPFTPPLSLAADGALILIAADNTNTFGFWHSPQDHISLVDDSLYRAVFTISADATSGYGVPTLRLRAGSTYHQVAAGKHIVSVGDALDAPTSVARDLALYFASPHYDMAEERNLVLAFDILNFDPDDNTSQTIRLHNITVSRFALPSELVP